MMPYPLGKLIWGIPMILLAALIAFFIRKNVPQRTGMAGWVQEKRIVTLTALLTLGIATIIYFFYQGSM